MKCGGLPPYTFISAEAVYWAKNNIENVLTEGIAISLFQSMVEAEYICHASGDKTQPFKYGFYLYCIIDANSPKNLFYQESDIKMFEKEWMEVGIVPQSSLAKNYEEWYTTADELYSTGLSSEVQGIFSSLTLYHLNNKLYFIFLFINFLNRLHFQEYDIRHRGRL